MSPWCFDTCSTCQRLTRQHVADWESDTEGRAFLRFTCENCGGEVVIYEGEVADCELR